MRLLVLLVAFALAGCTAPAETNDVVAPEPVETVEEVLEPVTYTGTTLRAAIFCEETAKKFKEDHAGWSYVLDSDGTATGDQGYVVWEDSDGARFAADANEGKVPGDAAAVVVCLDVSSQGQTMDWAVTMTPPAQSEAAEA